MEKDRTGILIMAKTILATDSEFVFLICIFFVFTRFSVKGEVFLLSPESLRQLAVFLRRIA